VPLVALLLAIAAIAVTVALQRQVSEARDSELDLQTVKLKLSNLQTLPFQAFPGTGGSPVLARVQIAEGERTIADRLDVLRGRRSPPVTLDRLESALAVNDSTLDSIYALGIASSADGGAPARGSGLSISPKLTTLAREAAKSNDRAVRMIDATSGVYSDRATMASRIGTLGAAAVILLLFAAFAFYYRRSVSAARANSRLLTRARRESLTDALTGIGNRRALINDLDDAVAQLKSEGVVAEGGGELMLTLYDLDGFKQYNDTFGHQAGDALLRHLGRRLAKAVDGHASAYRMGGDEFCILARVDAETAEMVAGLGSLALTDMGKGFRIECSHGMALIDSEAHDAEGALHLADQRMYAHKAEVAPAQRQSSDVLLQVQTERSAALGKHVHGVAVLVEAVARRLGNTEPEVQRIRTAAELHDVGKTGVPDAILNKPGPLDADEVEFMNRHTLIGERILRAAPSLAPAADLVRSHHERMDGGGYPDGLKGDEIPFGARIIFACDAFNGMTSKRPYRMQAMSVPDALAELRRCAGTQFDPLVVAEIVAVVESGARSKPRVAPVAA
jgi:diguanylate cyclase (GGDEF)-like protein